MADSNTFSSSGPRWGRDRFAALATGYLLLPNLVFLVTWLRPGIGLPVAAVALGAFVLFWRQRSEVREMRPALSRGTWILVLSLALVWSVLAGMGGFVYQASDYEKHNLAFHDLVTYAWPVRYTSEGQDYFLCYGSGYYLVPALVARLMSGAWLPGATLVWGFLGVALIFYWVATFSGSPKKTLGIVLLFAATEALWHLYLHILHSGHFAEAGKAITASFERLGTSSDYSDCFAALQFRPQHVLPAWLGTALFYDAFWVRRDARGAGLAWAASWLWSPLAALGLLVVPLAAWGRWRWRTVVGAVNVGAAVLLVAVAVYFQGHVAILEQGPIWSFSTGNQWLWMYPWFVLLELSPMALLCLADYKYDLLGEWRALVWWAVAVLILLPWYKIGYYGDLRLQAQTPALLICGLGASRCFQNANFSVRRPLCALLVASQLAGMAYPFARWWQDALRARTDYSFEATNKLWEYQNLADFKRFGYDYAAQYLGRTNSAAARWLLRAEADGKR